MALVSCIQEGESIGTVLPATALLLAVEVSSCGKFSHLLRRGFDIANVAPENRTLLQLRPMPLWQGAGKYRPGACLC